jgi:hypothetical protein
MSGISLQQKKDPRKKERKKKRKREKGREKKEQGLKSKRGETSYEEALCFKRRKEKKEKMMKFTSCWERFYQTKGDHIFLLCKIQCVAPYIRTHHFHLHYLLFLGFSLSYPHSLHHSPSTMIICHTNSLDFSFAFTIYKV